MRTRFGRWVEYLAAVLIGNAFYFLFLMPLLPISLRHEVFAIDAGLAVDFLLCALILVVIRWWRKG